MKNKHINPANGESIDYQNLTDVQTQKRIEEHMSNINDKITEDDIKNIRTDMYDDLLKNDHTDDKNGVITKQKEEYDLKEKEKEESEKVNSTWNILED